MINEGEKAMAGPLATANQEIRQAERQSIEQHQARLVEPKRLTDQMLSQLEELNLDGVRNVPDAYEPLLAGLRDQLTTHPEVDQRVIARLQVGTKIADVIDAIFVIQEIIAPPTLPDDSLPFEDAIH